MTSPSSSSRRSNSVRRITSRASLVAFALASGTLALSACSKNVRGTGEGEDCPEDEPDCEEPCTSAFCVAGSGGESGEGGSGGESGNTGGGSSGGAGPDGSGGYAPGECDPGYTQSEWAGTCATTGADCTAGTWTDGGPDPGNSSFTKCDESEHFVIYSGAACPDTAEDGLNHLESVWETFFGSPMFMEEPLCQSITKNKAVVHVDSAFGLTGGAWSGNRMGMWVGPGALSDHWGLAHEFMHGVQSVSGGQSCNGSNTCGWIYESHANWAAQQQEEYHTGDVHCSEMRANMPHLHLGSTRDRYCNWQFMEYLKDKHCFSAVHAMWTGDATADPFTGIREGMGWTVADLNDFMGDWAMHNVTWDYEDPLPQSSGGDNLGTLFRGEYGLVTDTSSSVRLRRTAKLEPLDGDYTTNRRFVSPHYWAPQRYGYNIVRLVPEAGSTQVSVTFRGVTSAPESPDWRWGFVATDSGITTPRYSTMRSGADGQLDFCINEGEEVFLVVTATPSEWYDIVWDQPYNTIPRYPYMVEIQGAWPEGFSASGQDACPDGLARAENGGGCAPAGTTSYVGPYATVLSGGSVTGSGRVEGHAIVANGTVSGGTVGALTIVGSSGGFGSNAFNVTAGSATTTFYPLGFFESGQSLSGGNLVGDVELRGGGYSVASGTCAGFVDTNTCVNPGTDATPAPPYEWRE